MKQNDSLQIVSFDTACAFNNSIFGVAVKPIWHKLFLKLQIGLFLFLVLGKQGWGQLFEQNFSSSITVSDYVNTSPSNGQFNAIGTSGAGTVLSINTTGSNKLRFARTANAGSYSRTADFSSTPLSLMYRFDLTISANTIAQTTAAVWQVGSGFGTANSAQVNADVHSRIGLNTTTTDGQFSIRDIGASTNSSNYTGTQRITWIINNSGGTLTYKAPNGTYETVADDKADLWVGTTKELNEISATTTNQSLTDLKFAFTAGPGTVDIDNILIDPVPTIPTSSASTSITSASFNANWSVVSGITGYRIDVATDAGFTSVVSGFNDLYIAGQATSSFNVTGAGINPGTTYYYRVRAASKYIVGEFASGNSATQNLSTCAAAPTGSNTQIFCNTSSPKISDLNATGTAIKWYNDPTAGTQYATTDPLVNGRHYYASQTVGCESKSRLDVTAIVNAPPTANAGTTPTTICDNGTYVVAGSFVTNNVSFTWTTSGDGTFSSNNNSSLTPTYTPGTNDKSSRIVTITLTAVGNSPCANATSHLVLTINSLPLSSTITVTNSICQPGCFVSGGLFIIPSCNGSTMTFYDDASGTNPRIIEPVYQQETAMTIYYACVNTITGCRSAIQSLTTVPGTCPGTPFAPLITATNSNCQSGCTVGGGSLYVITACGAGTTLTYFTDNTGATITGAPMYNQTTPMTIYYACVDNSTGCRSAIQTLTTVPGTCNIPSAPLITATESICQSGCIVNGGSFNIITSCTSGRQSTTNIDVPTNTLTYFSNEFGADPTTIQPAYNQTTPITIYYACMNTVTGCRSAIQTLTTVPGTCTLPATPTISAGGPTTFCSGGSAILTSNSASGIQWRRDGSPIGGASAQNYIASVAGDYTVIVTSALGCSSAPSIATTVRVNNNPGSSSIIIVESTCQSGCTVGGGSISVNPCSGSVMIFYDDVTGANPTTTFPTYNQTSPITINYACLNTTTGCRSAIQTVITVPGTCTLPGVPTGSAAQSLCSGSTVAALTATGSNIQWYSLSSGGGALPPGTPLTTSTIYYASQTVGLCESTVRFVVTVTLLPAVNVGSVNLIKVNHLVISQVYSGGGNSGSIYKNDFIEIFNPTASTISVAGWSVQYASSAGSSWSVTNLSGSIAAGKYYLVQQAAGGGGTTNLPTPDDIGTIAMSASAGKVALVSSTTALSGACPLGGSIVDFIGYGSTANCSETAATATLTNTTAAIRADAGCTDLNNNSTDFAISGAPTPRNSATAATICHGTSLETICSGNIPGSMSATGATGGSGTFSYLWYSRSGNTCPTGIDISGWTPLTAANGTGFNTITFTPSVAVTSTISFACLVTPGGSPVCGVPTWASGCKTISVNSVTGGTIAADQSSCPSGDPAPFTESVASTGGGTLTYQWQSSTVSDFSSVVTSIGGANTTTYDAPSGLGVTTYYRRITSSMLNSIACTANSNIISVTVSAGPEINLTGLGISIPDGSSSPILSNHTDFGSVSACLGKIIRTFTIENSGVSNLVIPAAGITLTGTDAAMFSIDGITLPATIEVGSSTTFTVTFDPSTSGLKTATANIVNNDCNENPYDIAIRGTGLDPEIDIKGNSVSITDGDVTPSLTDHTDFGSVLVSTPFARTYTISNSGTSNLTIGGGAITTSGSDASMYVVSGITLPATIAPAGSATCVVTFTPTSLGLKNTTLNIANNDCDENPYNFSIQGTGISCSINRFGAGSNIQAVCPSIPITNITYTTTGATGASFSGLPPGVNGNWASNVVTISGAPTTSLGSAFNYIVTLTGGCGSITATGTITIFTLPALFTITGGGAYCFTDTPYPIRLSGSEEGVSYQLFNGPTPFGTPKFGTGSVINFGPQPLIGTYTIVATRSGCTRTMTGTVTVSTITCGVSISDPCTCFNNATTLTNGQFGETVTVNAPTGQTWTVTSVTGLYATASPAPPLAPIPILVGATMTEGPAGVYNLSGKHIDAIGYSITVNNGLGSILSIGNLCEYPNPVITGLAPAICANNTPITFTGIPGDANIASQSFTINGAPATQFTPSSPGTYVIGYTVNGGVAKAFGANDPGCTQTVTQSVSVITSVAGTILSNSNATICAGQSTGINLNLSGAPNFTGVFNIAVQNGSGIPTASFPFTATTNGASAITIPAGNLTNTSSSPVTYRVSWVLLSDLSGCPVLSLTGSANIIVYPIPTITVSVTPVGDICPGSIISFTVTNPNNIPGSKWNGVGRDGLNNIIFTQYNNPFGLASFYITNCNSNNPYTMTFIPVGPNPLGCQGTPVTKRFTFRDAVAPVLKNGALLPANQTGVNACKANAPASPTVSDIKVLYTDNCTTDANLVVAQTVNTITGDDCNWTATYKFTIKDACNNTTTVTISHTGKDLTPPIWTSVAGSLNRTVEYCDVAVLNAAQTLVPEATDNCGGLVSYFKTGGVFAQTGCSHNGIITNTFVAKDPCLNTSIVFTQVITITDNNGPTVFPIQGSIPNQNLDIGGVGCNTTLPSYISGPLNQITSALDCNTAAGSIPAGILPVVANYPVAGAVTLTQSPAAGVSVFGPGGTILPVTITATDVCGKTTTRTFNVNIVDATAPIARCHVDSVTLATDGTAFILPTFLDGNANGVSGLGPKLQPNGTVGARVFSADNCTAVTLKFRTGGTFISPVLADTVKFNCGNVPTGFQNNDLIANDVILRVTDVAGNASECIAKVRVVENTKPVFTTCPTTVFSVNKDVNCVYTMEDMRTRFPNQFIAKDSCGPTNSQNGITYTQFPLPGSFMGGLASTTVTITATDTHTNTATCVFTLNMNDVTAPVFTCPNQNQVLPASAGFCNAVSNTWVIPTATDACSPSNGLGPITYSVAVTGNTTLPTVNMSTTQATFYVGVTTITYTARDQAGNTSTCSFTVTVVDNVKPVITCPGSLASPAIVSGVVTLNVNAGLCSWQRLGTGWDATATDNCLLSSVTYRLSPATVGFTQTSAQNDVTLATGTSLANVVFSVGVTKVAWIATDFSGNRDSCILMVRITDNVAPTFTCPANFNYAVNAAACSANVPASLTSATNIADACGVTLQEWDVSFPLASGRPPASGTGQLANNFNFPSGTSTVQYRIRDAANNIAVCSFTVSTGSGVTGTIGTDATVGQNIATTSTIVFTGAGSAAAAGTQQYTFNYSLSVNGGAFVSQGNIQTAVGSNVITVPQSNAAIGSFSYRLNSVSDGNTCPGTVVGVNTATINIVVGNPSLMLSVDMAPDQVNAGGIIEEAIVVRNNGTAPTAGLITVNASVYSALTGLTVAQNLTNATINGTPYTATAGWTFNALAGDFTSSAVIPAGGGSTIRIRITRGSGLLAGSASQVNHTITVSGGSEPAQQANDGTNTVSFRITKN